MPMFSRVAFLSMLGLACGVAAPSWALDGTDTPATAKAAPLHMFKTPYDALKQGLEGYRSGDVKSSVRALEYAAAGGQPLARWKLAKMYADGDGVPQNDVKAYEYFSQIIANYDEDDPNRRELSVVAGAFVAVGVYCLTGIANSKVDSDPERAMELFQFAATNFGDANAQYNMARMFLDGNGVGKDARQAARWLSLAAEKNHFQAQALLGHLLFNGQDGVARQRARGLMLLSLARDSATDPVKDAWVVELYSKALGAANDNDRQAALAYLSVRGKK